jgi:hypothetical protein
MGNKLTRPTKTDYIAYMKRWRTVNEYERSELRRTPVAHKLKQLATLMASRALFPRDEASLAEDAEAYERWNALRNAYRG